MPLGIIANVLAVFIGGIAGTVFGKKLSQKMKDTLNLIFGLSAMMMGITSIMPMKNMPPVILAVILGTAIGVLLKLEDRINKGAVSMQKLISRFTKGPGKTDSASKEEYTASLVTIIILFCTSATGIYGSMVSGMSGEHTILFSKSILDFFTAMIFACSLGMVVSFIAVPQLLIFLAIFFLARVIFPLTNESMIADFKACGGMILLATSFRMIKVKMFPIADMIPAMIIVMPLSYLWSAFILPLL